MTPNISIRESIRWPPDVASEPTSTVVLTSAKRYYVDIRIKHPTTENENKPVEEDLLPASRIDWAFAGTSSSEIRHLTHDTQIIHSQWKHWVDSSTTDPEAVMDEGDMLPDEGGELALEKGRMVNPATGLMADYEEMWREVAPKLVQTPGTVATNTGSVTESVTNDGKHACVVLLLQGEETQDRGMVIRVGQHCQGIIRTGEQITLERWEWKEEGGWRRKMRTGGFWLPCGAAMADPKRGRLVEGGEIKEQDNVWTCMELSWF